MTDATVLAIVGAAQAVILGYLEIIRRSARKCGSVECIENLNNVLDKRAQLREIREQLDGVTPSTRE